MKSTAKFLTGITLVVVALVAYYILSSQLSVFLDVRVQPATQNAEAFLKISDEVAQGKHEGVYSLKPMEAYSFVTVTAEIKNYSPFPAEWTQLVLKAENGDLLTVSSDAGPKDIPALKEGTVSLTILTESKEPNRGGWLEYYIFGRSHSIEVFPETAK